MKNLLACLLLLFCLQQLPAQLLSPSSTLLSELHINQGACVGYEYRLMRKQAISFSPGIHLNLRQGDHQVIGKISLNGMLGKRRNHLEFGNDLLLAKKSYTLPQGNLLLVPHLGWRRQTPFGGIVLRSGISATFDPSLPEYKLRGFGAYIGAGYALFSRPDKVAFHQYLDELHDAKRGKRRAYTPHFMVGAGALMQVSSLHVGLLGRSGNDNYDYYEQSTQIWKRGEVSPGCRIFTSITLPGSRWQFSPSVIVSQLRSRLKYNNAGAPYFLGSHVSAGSDKTFDMQFSRTYIQVPFTVTRYLGTRQRTYINWGVYVGFTTKVMATGSVVGQDYYHDYFGTPVHHVHAYDEHDKEYLYHFRKDWGLNFALGKMIPLDGLHYLNVELQVSQGMQRLYSRPVLFQRFTGVQVGYAFRQDFRKRTLKR